MNEAREYFMLVKRGQIQLMDGGNRTALPVAECHEDASMLASWFNETNNGKCSPARIGSVHGETLETTIMAALNAGADSICCVNGWSDGSPQWKTIDMAAAATDKGDVQ